MNPELSALFLPICNDSSMGNFFPPKKVKKNENEIKQLLTSLKE